MGETFARAEMVIQVIRAKWSVRVLGELAGGPRRHNALRRAVGQGIHQQVLDGVLGLLVEAGLVRRIAGPAPATWYELTGQGRSLVRDLEALGRWAQRHEAELARFPVWATTELSQNDNESWPSAA